MGRGLCLSVSRCNRGLEAVWKLEAWLATSQVEWEAQSRRLGPFPFPVSSRPERPWGNFPGFTFTEHRRVAGGGRRRELPGLPVPEAWVSPGFRDLIFPLVVPSSSEPLGEVDARRRRPNTAPVPLLSVAAPSRFPSPRWGGEQHPGEGGAGKKQVKETLAPPLAGEPAVCSQLERWGSSGFPKENPQR